MSIYRKYRVGRNKTSIKKDTWEIEHGYEKKELGAIEKSYGVYVFVLEKDFEYKRKMFEKEVTGKYKVYDENIKKYINIVHSCATAPNFPDKTKILKANHIVYIGSAQDLHGRVNEHLTSNKINNTVSLKLGFVTRKEMKDCIVIYVKLCKKEDYKREEARLQGKYNYYFGRKSKLKKKKRLIK